MVQTAVKFGWKMSIFSFKQMQMAPILSWHQPVQIHRGINHTTDVALPKSKGDKQTNRDKDQPTDGQMALTTTIACCPEGQRDTIIYTFTHSGQVTHICITERGLSPIQRQAITWTNDCKLDPKEHSSVKFPSKLRHFHWWNCIWKCYLPKWRPSYPGLNESSALKFCGISSAIHNNVIWSVNIHIFDSLSNLEKHHIPLCGQQCACWWPSTTRC